LGLSPLRFERGLGGHGEVMIGRLEPVALDARDPHELARFYANLWLVWD
jgi:hypothetical protein